MARTLLGNMVSKMLSDFDKRVLSDIKSNISTTLSSTKIPSTANELATISELYHYIDKSMCKLATGKKTTTDVIFNEDVDKFISDIVEYAIELDKTSIPEVKNIVKLLDKLIEGEDKK